MRTRKLVLLDTGVLGMVTHPTRNKEAGEWLRNVLRAGDVVYIPEICDYEVRRELLRAGKARSIIRMDTLKLNLGYLPINTEMMLRAAEFWAEARKKGMPTADDRELDADVILAAQADVLRRDTGLNTVIATTNAGHLARFVSADFWQNIR